MNIRQWSIALVALAALASHAHGGQLLYLAANQDKSIAAYEVHPDTGVLLKKFEKDLPGNPGPLTFSPDTSRVYAALTGLDQKKAGVATLARHADGSLSLLNTAIITSRSPYIRTDHQGRYLFAAHYGAGGVTVWRIVDGVCTDELLDNKQTEKTAHCVETDPSGQYVFVPHTTPNKVYQFHLDAGTGHLIPNEPPFVAGPEAGHEYHEPRHIVFHPRLPVAYTSNEKGGGITAWDFDVDSGTLTRTQTLSTLPPDYSGGSAAADIHMTPDGRYVYVSNRDLEQRDPAEGPRDTLAGFALDAETGLMTPVGHFATAHFPRSFCIDLSGRFLFAAGQRSSTLVAYRIDKESGKLDRFATYATGRVPIWVMCGKVDN